MSCTSFCQKYSGARALTQRNLRLLRLQGQRQASEPRYCKYGVQVLVPGQVAAGSLPPAMIQLRHHAQRQHGCTICCQKSRGARALLLRKLRRVQAWCCGASAQQPEADPLLLCRAAGRQALTQGQDGRVGQSQPEDCLPLPGLPSHLSVSGLQLAEEEGVPPSRIVNGHSACKAQGHLAGSELQLAQEGPARPRPTEAGTEVFLQPVQAWNFPMNMRGKVFQQPTYKAYPDKVFKQGQEAPCRNEALAAGLAVYQLPQNVLPGLEVVMAIIYITRVYCSLIFSSVLPQQTPQQRTQYITQYGTGQRLQVLLAKSPSGKLDLTFKTLNNADTKAINDQLTDEQKAEVLKHKAVLTKYFTRLLPVLVKLLGRPINALATIINDPVNKRKMVGEGDEQEMLIEPAQHAAPPQAPHTDFKPVASGLDDGFVFLLACQDFDLVAYMYSHLLMEHAAPYYKNGNPDLPSLTAIATHALLREGTLVQVKAGQLVLFRGNTVHAGTAGRPDSCGARLYGFGKTGQPADNTTVNMSQLGPVFEGLFQPTQGGTITAQTGEWNRRGQAGRMVPDTEPYEPSDGI
ncbi:hypothetical protein V8C86DRAFT_2436422 [Haematococcus lacustris]